MPNALSLLRSTILALLVLAGVLGIGGTTPAQAHKLPLNDALCHAVTPLYPAALWPPALHYSCKGDPVGYQQGSLWLKARFNSRHHVDGDAPVLFVHQSRFDAVGVYFTYADGKVMRDSVRSGDFGDHWRIGGQIAFAAPQRDAALTGIVLRYDRLASHSLVRANIRAASDAGIQTGLAALLIGGALTLLLAGALFNIALALAVRQAFLAWQGIWAAILFAWGAIWSQLTILIFPGMAGTQASQICTLLASLAVTAATACAMTLMGRDVLPRPVRMTISTLGISVGVLGVPACLIRDSRLDGMGDILGILILATLAGVAACILWTWRRSSPAARDFALAWIVPMVALALTEFLDFGDALFGGGPQIVVLFASAFQTLWLSIAAARRLSRLRGERDSALAAEAHMSYLANRDALTGLLNRRGFIQRFAEQASDIAGSVGLLLIDVDHFKDVNDRYGHEAGDAVLARIAQRLARWEGEMCFAGRLGGEEFVLAIAGLNAFALDQFAQGVRSEISACAHPEMVDTERTGRDVTVSIGVAVCQTDAVSFQTLYKEADQRLYEAKTAGRNRVVSPVAASAAWAAG